VTGSTRRESYHGFDLGKLRKSIRDRQGLGTTEQMFSSRGDPWTSTRTDNRLEETQRALNEHLLRNAHKADDEPAKPIKRDPALPFWSTASPLNRAPTPAERAQLIAKLRERLQDHVPPAERPKYDKKALSKQRLTDCSLLSPVREPHETKGKALRRDIAKLARLEYELAHKQRTKQDVKIASKYKAHKHFTLEIGPMSPEERERLKQEIADKASYKPLYRVYKRDHFRDPWVLFLETEDQREAEKTSRHVGTTEDVYTKIEEISL